MLTTIATFLFGGMKWIKEAVGALSRIVGTYPLQTALIVSLVACWWFYSGREKAQAEYADLQRDFVEYQNTVKKSSEQAIAKAKAEKQRKEAEYERLADNANQAYDDLRSRYRAMLVRSNQENSGRPSGADLPNSTSAPGLPQIASSDPGFLISSADAIKTADVSAYAMACYRWADSVAGVGH